MRRAALTARRAASLAFGNPAVSGGQFQTANNLTADRNTTCPGTGTLTVVNFYATTATTITVYTGTMSGSTFTIRSSADVTSDGSGAQTRALSLPVMAGDYFAVWTSVSVAHLANATGAWAQANVGATKPTSGSFNLTAAGSSLQMNLA